MLLHINPNPFAIISIHCTPPSVSPSSLVITYVNDTVILISSISLISLLFDEYSQHTKLHVHSLKHFTDPYSAPKASGKAKKSETTHTVFPLNPDIVYSVFHIQKTVCINDTVLVAGYPLDRTRPSGYFVPNVKPAPEHIMFRLVCGGESPFLAQYNAVTEKTSSSGGFLKGVATVFAGILQWGRPKPENEQPFSYPTNEVPKESFIHPIVDANRVCLGLSLSPCGKYVAVTDSFGRVSVVESETGQMLHLFKGRRNASIAWLRQKVTDSATNSSRLLLFLVIVSPQRGIVEVFLLPHFSRVGGLNIDGSVRSVQMMYPISITQPLSVGEGGSPHSITPFIAIPSFEQPVYLIGNKAVYSLRVSLNPTHPLPPNTSISSPYSSTLIAEITGESDTPHPSQAQTPTILLEKPKIRIDHDDDSSWDEEEEEGESSSDG